MIVLQSPLGTWRWFRAGRLLTFRPKGSRALRSLHLPECPGELEATLEAAQRHAQMVQERIVRRAGQAVSL